MTIKQGYTKVMDTLRQAKEVWAAIATIVVGTAIFLSWMTTSFLSVQAAELTHKQMQAENVKMVSDMAKADLEMADQIKNLTIEVSQTNTLLALHMDKHSLEAVSLAIQNNESEIFNLEQTIRSDSNNAEAARRLLKLKSERDDLQIKRNCIITDNPRCD